MTTDLRDVVDSTVLRELYASEREVVLERGCFFRIDLLDRSREQRAPKHREPTQVRGGECQSRIPRRFEAGRMARASLIQAIFVRVDQVQRRFLAEGVGNVQECIR